METIRSVLGEVAGAVSGVPWPGAPAAPGNLLEMQSLWATSELTQFWGPRKLSFNEAPSHSVCAENMCFSAWAAGDTVGLWLGTAVGPDVGGHLCLRDPTVKL